MAEPETPSSSSEVLARVNAAAAQGQAILYSEDMPDKEHPAVRWSIYGLISTNEMAVVAKCATVRVGACAPSNLHFPAMADRIFGIDVADAQLAERLAEDLWRRDGQSLIDAATAASQSPS